MVSGTRLTNFNGAPRVLRMPDYFLYAVIGICVLPYVLMQLGLEFGSPSLDLDLNAATELPKHQYIDLVFTQLSGAFTHTILEWTAFCVAILTVFLAASHYYISRNVTTLVIGSALFLAGCMDAFHTLAADRLIDAVADNRDLIPFTWAISRIFNALILISGVLLLLLRKSEDSYNTDLKKLFFYFVGSAVVAYAIISYCAASESLPQTQFPDNLITRPYDVAPLILYILAGLFLFPYFYRKQPSVFAHALIIAMIPEVMVELHMAFGASALFDSHFNIAHFLKILAYAIPFLGLLMDHIHTYETIEHEVRTRELTEKSLHNYTLELERSNKELNDFAYVASHDLKAPLRGIMQLASWIEEDVKDTINDQTKEYLHLLNVRTERLEQLLSDLLGYSRAGQKHGDIKTVSISQMCEDIFLLLNPPKGFSLVCDSDIPTIATLFVPLDQILRNLINNAIKHHDRDSGTIRVGVKVTENGYDFSVSDDGPGIAPEHSERVFGIFQTLKPRDELEGSGMGLAIIKKLLDNYQCDISVISDGIRGTSMNFNWPTEEKLRGYIRD